jgi:membrane protein YdbS with pleckstrin-like domain
MKQIIIKPEVEQKTKWYILWWLFFLPITTGLTLLLVIIRYPESVAILTTLIMFLIAALITLFWIPAFHKSLLYEINDESITSSMGVFWKNKITTPLSKIVNVDARQGPLQRMFKMGNVIIQTANENGIQAVSNEIQFVDIKMFEETKNEIMLRINNVKTDQTTEVISNQSKQSESEMLKNIIEEVKSIKKSIEGKK